MFFLSEVELMVFTHHFMWIFDIFEPLKKPITTLFVNNNQYELSVFVSNLIN